MADVDPQVIARLNSAVKERLSIEVELNAITEEFKADKKRREDAFTEQTGPLQERAAELDNQIWHELETNRSTLIKQGKQSFATMVARFQLQHRTIQAKVVDENGILDTARQLRIIRKIADPPRIWRLNLDKFNKWLDHNEDYRHLFTNFISKSEVRESLTAQPNTNYTVLYDGKRISPPSISIKKS